MKSLRALDLEGCPKPLLFQDKTFIIVRVRFEEVLFLLGSFACCPCCSNLECSSLLGSEFLKQCIYEHFLSDVVWLIFYQDLASCGKGYFTFYFESKDDRDLIFRNRPYLMDSRGIYLNKWTANFDPKLDVPSAVPVWVRLPHLPCIVGGTTRSGLLGM